MKKFRLVKRITVVALAASLVVGGTDAFRARTYVAAAGWPQRTTTFEVFLQPATDDGFTCKPEMDFLMM
jgi:hypothetical protein